MSDPKPNVQNVGNSSSTTTKVTGAPTKGASGNFQATTSETTVENMNQLKERAPEVYKAMMMGWAQHITSEMKQHQDELKRIMREAEQQSQG